MPTPLLSRKAVSPTGLALVGDLFELLGVHAFYVACASLATPLNEFPEG
jgi:hypothetical protein